MESQGCGQNRYTAIHKMMGFAGCLIVINTPIIPILPVPLLGRLKEIGPRMSLTLTKITEGFCAGDVLYHRFDTLTDEQKVEIAKKKEERK